MRPCLVSSAATTAPARPLGRWTSISESPNAAERMIERGAREIVLDLLDRQAIAGRHDVVLRELRIGDPNVAADHGDVARERLRAGGVARGDRRERLAFAAGGNVVDFDLSAIGDDDQAAAGRQRRRCHQAVQAALGLLFGERPPLSSIESRCRRLVSTPLFSTTASLSITTTGAT